LGRAFVINDRQARSRCGSIDEGPLATYQEKSNEWAAPAQWIGPWARAEALRRWRPRDRLSNGQANGQTNRQAAATGAPPKRAAFFYDAKRQNKKANREGWLFALRRFTLGADNRELVAGVCLSRVFGG